MRDELEQPTKTFKNVKLDYRQYKMIIKLMCHIKNHVVNKPNKFTFKVEWFILDEETII